MADTDTDTDPDRDAPEPSGGDEVSDRDFDRALGEADEGSGGDPELRDVDGLDADEALGPG